MEGGDGTGRPTGPTCPTRPIEPPGPPDGGIFAAAPRDGLYTEAAPPVRMSHRRGCREVDVRVLSGAGHS